MKELKLHNSDKVTVVDDKHFERLSKYKWYLVSNSVRRAEWHGGKIKKTIFISIANDVLQDYSVIYDHRDTDSFNNLESNLRQANYCQNNSNRNKQANTTSRYKGVYWNKLKCKWVATLYHLCKKIHLGYFSNEIEAAVAYDDAAIIYHGEFAKLNFQLYGA